MDRLEHREVLGALAGCSRNRGARYSRRKSVARTALHWGNPLVPVGSRRYGVRGSRDRIRGVRVLLARAGCVAGGLPRRDLWGSARFAIDSLSFAPATGWWTTFHSQS